MLRPSLLVWCATVAALLGACPARAGEPADPPPERWTKQVEAYEKRDAKKPPPQGAVVFAGSSSIRMWPDIEEAFAPTPVVARGIGGSHVSDQVHWADRLVLRYRPTQIVFYAGDNDVAGGKSAERVLADFKRYVALVRKALPKVWVHFLAIKPSPRREALWPAMKRANALVAEYAETAPRVTFIDVATPMLDANGRPRRDIFLKDMLHMNREGYALWVPRVKAALAKGRGGEKAGGAASTRGDIVLENARFRAVLGADARWQSLRDKAANRDCLAKKRHPAFAAVKANSKWHEADSAAMADGRLAVGFAGVDTRLVYRVQVEAEWVGFRIETVEGIRPTEVTLARLATSVSEHVGPRLSGGWDATTGVALVATNLQSGGDGRRRGDVAELDVTSQDAPGPRLEGAGAALVVAPIADFDATLARLAKAYDLPRNTNAGGVPSKQLPVARGAYWFLRFGEADVDRVLALCRQSGFRQVMMLSHSWCKDVGHYTFRTSVYPDGLASLERTVARLHEAGILVGMHGYASKISKTDAFVTPVPDRRFWLDRTATLAEDLDAAATAIRTSTDLREWPGSPVAKQKTWEGGVTKHQEVILDDEIVRYKAIGPEGGWNTFLGCTRGAWGTKAAAHKAGTVGRHYGVDGCINGYIIDQDTGLLDEATGRLARIFNTCGFDLVYFDGGEDVDRRRFRHYVSNFQAVAMSKFTRRPLVHMGTIMTHRLWHSFTRRGTVDTYQNTIRGRLIAGGTWDTLPTVRDHIDRSVDHLLRCRDDRLPGELGWFGIWPRSEDFEGLQLDEIEYLMAKSLAYDAPISLQTSFSRMDAHPLTPGILKIVRAYDALRMAGAVPPDVCEGLRPKGKDVVLLRRRPGAAPAFVPVEPVEKVAGEADLRACVGEAGGDAIVTLWHAVGKEGTLTVTADPTTVSARDVFGQAIELTATGEQTVIPFGHRRIAVVFEGLDAKTARKRLAEGTVN